MSATPISAITKYTSRGSTRVVWCTTVANPAAVLRSEINAGTDLSGELADASGWSVKSNQIDTPDLQSRYTSTIPGVISADDSSITMYMSKDGVDARALMPRDEVGYIIWMDGGDVAANLCDVFPVTVSAVSKMRQVDGSKADTVMFSFAITSEPSENVAVPA
jgi:hypothetical protein